MTYTPAQVNAWYQSVQFRDGPTSTVTSYVSLLNSGLMQPVDVQTAIINDTYTAANVNPVIRLYQAAFNRVPDQAGQNAWADALGGTPDAQKPAVVQQLATDFANSPEFFSNYGVRAADPINSAVLTAFYQNVLNRAPDAAGYAFWLSSGLNVGQVLNSFAQSAEFVKNSDNSIVLYQQAEIAGNYATSGSLFQYGGYPGTTYILTTGIDATGSGAFVNGQPTGNSNIIGSYNNGSASTFNSGDQIAATGTGNTLSLTDGGGSSGAGGSTGNINSVAASVSGVQTLTVTSGEAIAFNGVTGTGGYTGLTQINATTASVGGNTAATPTSITAAATTNVTVTDTAAMGASANAFGGGVTVNGGKNISITEKGATTTASTIKVGGTTSTNPAGTVNVTVNAVSTSSPGNTKIAVDGGTSVSVTQGQTGTVVIGSATAPTGAVTVVDTGGTGDVNVLGGASATITETTLSAGYKAGQVLVSGVTGATTLTVSSTNTVAANSAATAISATNPTLSVTGGTGATIATTGANNYTSTAINAGYIYAGTADNSTITPIAGNISITDTFAGPGKDVISAFGTGSVTINSTRTSGTITVGNSTRANDPTGAVSITSLTNSGAVGAPNYYGTGNVAVNVNGSTTVSITGGKASSSSASYVTDRALTNALSTVSVTGFQGTTTNVLTINSTALSTLNISDNRAYNPLKVANANTAVVVSNSTVDHTLAINLQGNNNKASNGTGTGTFVQDSNAKVVNVTATGLTENYLQLVANDATSGVAQTFSFTNNSAGKLTITGLTAGSTGSPTNTVTVAGTGAVNLGDVTGWGTAPTSITSTRLRTH